MVFRRKIVLLSLLFSSYLNAVTYYEGTQTFRNYGIVDYYWMLQLLPYNPVIVEAGAYCGKETLRAAKIWPQSTAIHAFEPNPRAYKELSQVVEENGLERVKTYNIALHNHNGLSLLHLNRGPNNDFNLENESSLLPPAKDLVNYYMGPSLEVPCVVLDDWCRQNGIDRIDLLRLELEGLELQVLESSPQILKTVKVLIVQSFFFPYRIDMAYYFDLKNLLTEYHFVPLAHWYEQGGRGLAVYVSEELFEAYFVRCLGLGVGGLLYP